MSQYIDLGKTPESPEEREKLIAERIKMEDYLQSMRLTYAQKTVIDFLTSQKGYQNEDLEINKEFNVQMTDVNFTVTADIVLNVEGRRFGIIKCAVSSLESWERFTTAFCRIVESSQIPFAIVTDGKTARMIDAVTGKLLSEGIDTIPSKEDAVQFISKTVFCPYPADRLEKEKRILYAFDAIRCPVDTIGSE